MILGIDPGLKGALGSLRDDGSFDAVYDLPLKTHGKIKIIKCIDGRELFELLRINNKLDYAGHDIFIEDVHSMPGMDISTMFNFGATFGIIRGVCDIISTKVDYVSPQVWKRYFGLSKNKDDSLDLARQIFPEAAEEYLKRKKDEGRAEALLIARYGYEKFFR